MIEMWNRFMRKPIVMDWVTTAGIKWEIYYGPEAATGSNFGNGNNTLTKAEAGWDATGNGEHEGRFVTILSGDGAGDQFEILSNTVDTLTIDGNWNHDPDGQSFDISDEGRGDTTIMTSDPILIDPIPANIYELKMEVEFKQQTTAGDGECRATIEIFDSFNPLVESSTVLPGTLFSTVFRATTTIRSRRFIVNLNPISGRYQRFGDGQVRFRIRSRGTEDTTQWAVTDVKGRVLYVPI